MLVNDAGLSLLCSMPVYGVWYICCYC